jgi:hypothetical protein
MFFTLNLVTVKKKEITKVHACQLFTATIDFYTVAHLPFTVTTLEQVQQALRCVVGE